MTRTEATGCPWSVPAGLVGFGIGLVALALSVALAGAGPAEAAELDAACPDEPVARADFDDTDGNTHEAAIECVVLYEVTYGVDAGRYGPAGRVSRAQMASFVARAVGVSDAELPAPADQGFDDVSGGPHESAINQLAAAGIVEGTAASTYSPSLPVRRDQMATFLVRAFEFVTDRELQAPSSGFTDVDGNAHEDNIDKAAAAGFAEGTTSSTFSPADLVRRDQMASFVARVLDRLVREGALEPRGADDTTGEVRDDGIDGLTLDLPGSEDLWEHEARAAPDDPLKANLRDAFATSVTLRIDTPPIDQALAEQEATFEEHDYDYQEDWYEPRDVSGADRAVYYAWVTPSGDSAVETLLFEVGDHAFELTYSVYIEDLEQAPDSEAFRATIDSLEIEPEVFLEATSP